MLMITDKLPELVAMQVEAIKNLKIDKVTVWDTMGGDKGEPTTAKFMAGMLQALPPLQNLFEMAGMKLPEVLNVQAKKGEEPPPPERPSATSPGPTSTTPQGR